MKYVELSPKEIISYFKKEPIGMGAFGALYEYNRNTLLKLYYREFYQAFRTKKESDFRKDLNANIELMNFNFDFNRDKRLIELERRLQDTSSSGLVGGIATSRNYRVGILEDYYKDYELLMSKIKDYSISQRKYILEKVKEKILELFSVGIYPLDIKETNILLNDNMDVKVIDLDGEDVIIADEEYLKEHPYVKKECEGRLIEMEYRLLMR